MNLIDSMVAFNRKMSWYFFSSYPHFISFWQNRGPKGDVSTVKIDVPVSSVPLFTGQMDSASVSSLSAFNSVKKVISDVSLKWWSF